MQGAQAYCAVFWMNNYSTDYVQLFIQVLHIHFRQKEPSAETRA
jgi:hypothetical protein